MATQRESLEALSRAVTAALRIADTGELFESREGHALVNAMYAVTEVEGLYDLAFDIGRSAGIEQEPALAVSIYRALGRIHGAAPVLEMANGM